METQYEKKIMWTIKNFSYVESAKIYSDNFVVGDSKWRLLAYPRGCDDNKCLSLFLVVADSDSLPYGWKRHTKFRLTVVNQISEKLSQKVSQTWFDQETERWGFRAMLPRTKLFDDDVWENDEVKIVAEVSVLKVVGKSDVLEEISFVNESMDVKGFQVLPSQVESVNSLFEKHPEIASKLRLKNPHLRTTYLNTILSLTEILCMSREKLSIDDLANAYSTLSYVTKAGFKLDWLEKKLKEVGETRVKEIEEEMKGMKQKCADMEVLLEFLR